MNTRLALPLLLVALTAACGGSSTPAAPKADIAGLEQQAGMTGCVDISPVLAVAMAHCTYAAEVITVATFVNNDQRNLWVTANRAAAGGLGVKGDGWAAIVIDQQVAADLATALGGAVT